MKETVVVTGASGFVGRHLVPSLIQKGHLVIALSRRGTCFPGAENHLWQEGQLQESLQRVVPSGASVIHLAGLAHFHGTFTGRKIFSSSKDNLEKRLWVANEETTRETCRAARRFGARRVIYLSSIGAVTSESFEAIRPNTAPRPDSIYGKSKLASEIAAREELQAGTAELVILRPPLVYGPLNVANMSRLIRWVRSGWPIPLGAVKNRRSLIYVENLVSLIERMLTAKDVPSQPVLVSDGQDLSTPDLIREIALAGGWNSRLVHFPLFWLRLADHFFKTDIYRKLCGNLFLEISETESFYSWSPPFKLREGIFKTVAGYI